MVGGGDIFSGILSRYNMLTALPPTQYSKDGVLFMSVAPGVIDTGAFAGGTYLLYTCSANPRLFVPTTDIYIYSDRRADEQPIWIVC